MDNLIGCLVANAGVDRTVVEKSVAIILPFLLNGEDAVGESAGVFPGLGQFV